MALMISLTTTMNNKDPSSLVWNRGDNLEIHDTEELMFTDQITVEAWVECNDPQAENLQSLVSKWKPLDDFNTFSAFDAGTTSGLDSKGYLGATFDGRYVYFAPQANHTLCENGTRRHGIALRYDTHGNFKDTNSWQALDAGNIDGLNTVYFDGAVFDGRYMYFVPLYNGVVLRYDVNASFNNPDSWSAFDAAYLNTELRVGAIFDGRYIYFVPYSSGIVIRYDTHHDFSNQSSWTSYDAGNTSGLDSKGFDGAVFDGKYVYFIPYWYNTARSSEYFHGIMLRYDATKDFNNPASWTAYDAGNTDGLDTRGYNGAAFDGRYLYCAAWEKGDGEDFNIKGHGNFLRYDTVGNQGTFSLRYIDIGHNGGLGASLPGINFIVNTEKGAVCIRANKIPESGTHYIAGVYDSRRISLYIDGLLVNEQAAHGKIQNSAVPICIGKIQDGLGMFKGIVEKAEVFSSARSTEWIRQQYSTGKV